MSSGAASSSDYWTDDYLKDFEEWLGERYSSEKRVSEPPMPPATPTQAVGTLTYWNEHTSVRITIPAAVGPVFNLNIENQQGQRGLHIPSHRPIFSYQSVENIPTIPRRRDQAFATYADIVRSRYYGGHQRGRPTIS